MPLSPAPLLPGLSPLPTPGRQPPSPRAVGLGALIAVVTLVVALVAGQFLLPYALYLAPGLAAKAMEGGGVQNDTSFQGFVFNWDHFTAAHGGISGGYNTPASSDNMRSQAKDFHMNAVIIPVYADMPDRTDRKLSWDSRADNGHTLPDADYNSAIEDALKAHLVPILELRVSVALIAGGSDSPSQAGLIWASSTSDSTITPNDTPKSDAVGNLEHSWFDNYTAFAVHFAQMSQQHHLPFFIIGDGLSSLTYDTDSTNAKADPKGIVSKPGDSCPDKAAGRRECEWRHVVHAIKSANYPALTSNAALTGAAYTGKLIYAASWTHDPFPQTGGATMSEFDHITWWDAVDFIGVDANFPLTKDEPDAPVTRLQDAWHGQGQRLGGEGNIYQRLETVSDSFQRPMVFTGVQYASESSANTGNPNGDADEEEQYDDMQALIMTFSDASWWAGVFWDGDQPISPRSTQSKWAVSTNWAGDNLETSKKAGKWLASYYHDNPLQCSCT
jgi:hypothetical protein